MSCSLEIPPRRDPFPQNHFRFARIKSRLSRNAREGAFKYTPTFRNASGGLARLRTEKQGSGSSPSGSKFRTHWGIPQQMFFGPHAPLDKPPISVESDIA